MDTRRNWPRPEFPRGLKSEDERARRLSLVWADHISPLTELVRDLRKYPRVEVPYFDPLDGGVGAKILFLMEKPGPMTSVLGRRVGSGFVSRDNDDPTAATTFQFMQEAGVDRELAVLWNLIPWWNGTRGITGTELELGAHASLQLIAKLPSLKVVVLVGGRAARLSRRLSQTGLPVLGSAHPSPIVRASRPELWRLIPRQWARALAFV